MTLTHRIKVEAERRRPLDHPRYKASKIRLVGRWLTEHFQPGTYVKVTPTVLADGRRALILEEEQSGYSTDLATNRRSPSSDGTHD